MLTLHVFTFGVLLLGRLSPGPAALPYRHVPAGTAATQTLEMPLVSVITVRAAAGGAGAFEKPRDLSWSADWTREAADKAIRWVGLHANNAPLRVLREAPWSMDIAPTLVTGGGAAVVIKVAY